jgi:hypothetical protein
LAARRQEWPLEAKSQWRRRESNPRCRHSRIPAIAGIPGECQGAEGGIRASSDGGERRTYAESRYRLRQERSDRLEPNLGLSEEILTVCAGKDQAHHGDLESGARREFLGPGARKRGKPKSGHARAVSQQPGVRG